LEETTDALLTAPGYSPDGQRLVYLRIPLLTAEQSQKLGRESDARLKPLEDAVSEAWLQWWASGGAGKKAEAQPGEAAGWQPSDAGATQPTEAAATQPAIEIVDAALPPVTGTFTAMANTVFLPAATAELVVRDVHSGQVVWQTPVELPTPGHADIYMHTRPEFDAAGEWVYFTTGPVAMAVNPASGEKRVVAGKNLLGRLSPDGRTYAVFTPGEGDRQSVVGMIGTDGEMALYRRVPADSVLAVSWLDEQTLGLVAETEPRPQASAVPIATQPAATQPETNRTLVLHRLRRDGTLLGPIHATLPTATAGQPDGVRSIAIAPDGRHMVISNAGAVFATVEGRVLGQWRSPEKVVLEQPTFSPDSSRVAFKVSREIGEKTVRTEAIAVFSADGKLLYRVEIPAITPGTTRPATTQAVEQG